MTTTYNNPVKQQLKDGQKTCGAFLQLTSNIAAEILGQAGFDWLIIDMEHAPGDFSNLLGQLQAIGKNNAVPFVRAPWNDAVAIKKILDTGVQGVLIPYVNTAAEAADAVSACKYPPLGVRGVAGSPRAAGYGTNVQNYIANANHETVVLVAIETPEAVANLDEILATPNLDGIFIGPMDLATSMGYLGNPGHPEVQQAIATIEQKTLASDKFLGTIAPTWEKAQACYDKGYQWLILMQDSTGLAALANATAVKFKQAYRN
ncbi:MAG: 2,4-dihydroxyhept-2-ene-1,7-dioic acid aldolase [Gammaproteobacteria bacterium]|nr:2,4-dihydroxyhept-2-ene-1,7-dioic acid aldolase [Gammaproteobacteria bacterium]